MTPDGIGRRCGDVGEQKANNLMERRNETLTFLGYSDENEKKNKKTQRGVFFSNGCEGFFVNFGKVGNSR